MGTIAPAELELTTMVDRQIDGQMRDQVAAHPIAQLARGSGAAPTQGGGNLITGGATAETPYAIPYATLTAKHPDYQADYWRECRALYAGGPRLFLDKVVLERLFPRHQFEAADVYRARKERAFYIAYPGEIVDNLLAGFAADPIRLTAGTDDKTGEEHELPEWWAEFAEDVSAPGGETCPLGTFAVEWLREAMQTRVAWALVDLPRRDPDAPAPQSRLEEEQAGLVDPYVCPLPAESVIDWEEDEDTRELRWVLCYWRSRPRASITDTRELITERWVLWTATEWASYRCTWHPARPPRPEEFIARDGGGPHAFGTVPIVRLEVPEGMYAMGKMHSIAKEHFNKRNAVSWAEYKSLFAELYEFLGNEGAAFNPHMSPASVGSSEAQADPDRATNQTRGQGWTQVRGKDDSAMYVGPPTEGFKIALESCAELMRELHRVMFSMALSANMDSAAIKRSGDSKERDQASIAVILTKCGELIRDGVKRLRDLVARVHGDVESAKDVEPTGGQKFDAASVAATITEAVEFLNGVPQRSPTLTKRYLYKLYKLVAGASDLSDEDLEAMRKELDDAVTAESLMMTDPNAPPPVDPLADPPGAGEPKEPGAAPAKGKKMQPAEARAAAKSKPKAKGKPGATKRRMYP